MVDEVYVTNKCALDYMKDVILIFDLSTSSLFYNAHRQELMSMRLLISSNLCYKFHLQLTVEYLR